MSAGFTSGPWQAFSRQARGVHDGYFIDTAPGNESANDYVIADLIVGRHKEANARLIAAAPELYEALNEAQALMATARLEINRLRAVAKLPGQEPAALNVAIYKAKIALAKANGEQVHSDPLPKEVGR